MRKPTVLLVSLAAALAFGAGVARAILNGEPDNGRHPWAGLMIALDANNVPLWRCSGSLIDSNTFLTAAHCVGYRPEFNATPTRAVIWFAEGPVATGNWTGGSCAGKTGYPCTGDASGTPVPHPGWDGSIKLPNTHDVGVVQLSTTVTNRGYGSLSTAGYVDRLVAKKSELTVVGYGLQQVKPKIQDVRRRMLAKVVMSDSSSSNTRGYGIRYVNKGKEDIGGMCFGDSGGPVLAFDGQKEVIVAVNSLVSNDNCKGGAFAFRTDAPEARAFLAAYTTLP